MSGFAVPKRLLGGTLGAVLSAAVCAAYGDAPEGTASEASSDSRTDALAEVVVTAQKREEKLQDVGVTVAAVSGQQLQNAGVRDIKDLGNVVSGFHVSTSYDEYRWALSAVMEGFVGVNGSYQGQQSGDLSTEPDFNIPGYALFDARGGVEISSPQLLNLNL